MNRKWYAVRVRPGKEMAVEVELASYGIQDIYAPITEDHRATGNKIRIIIQPIVRGYIFPKLVMTDAWANLIANLDHVVGLLPSNNIRTPISESAIDVMRYECDKLIRTTEDTPDLDWMLGKTFWIETGAWAERSGPCIGFDRHDQPILMMEIFKSLEPIPVALGCLNLEPVETQHIDDLTAKRYNPGISKRRSQRRSVTGRD